MNQLTPEEKSRLNKTHNKMIELFKQGSIIDRQFTDSDIRGHLSIEEDCCIVVKMDIFHNDEWVYIGKKPAMMVGSYPDEMVQSILADFLFQAVKGAVLEDPQNPTEKLPVPSQYVVDLYNKRLAQAKALEGGSQ